VNLIPFLGGSFYSYNAFMKYKPSWIEMKTIEFPGHGERRTEPLLTDMNTIVNDIFEQIPFRRDN